MNVDDKTLTFAAWLDVLAPIYARLYLRPHSPLWNAIFDLRAAMVVDLWGDSSSTDWQYDEGIRHRAPHTLASCGLLLPDALFDEVWRTYREGSGGEVAHQAYDLWEPQVRARDRSGEDDGWARWRLLEAARTALRYGPDEASQQRYGCNPR